MNKLMANVCFTFPGILNVLRMGIIEPKDVIEEGLNLGLERIKSELLINFMRERTDGKADIVHIDPESECAKTK
jgi:hypothetical protein